MNKILLSFVAVAALSWPAQGQKVEVQKPDRGQILHVQTALNHLTVLEMTEAVSTVAVGSPVFKVEWRENKVFIQPTEQNVATNLFVWTASGRFNYEQIRRHILLCRLDKDYVLAPLHFEHGATHRNRADRLSHFEYCKVIQRGLNVEDLSAIRLLHFHFLALGRP